MGNTTTRPEGGKGGKVDTLAAKGAFDSCSIFSGHQDIIRCLVTVDSKTVASGADDGTIIVWDVVNRVQKLKINTAVALAGESDADSDSDDAISLWQPGRRAVRCLLPLSDLNVLVSCITNDASVTLWSLISGAQIAVLKGKHKGPIHCLAPVPGYSHLLATAGGDTVICLWTAAPAANSYHNSGDFGTDNQITQLVHSRSIHCAGSDSPLGMAETCCMGTVRRADLSAQWASTKDVSYLIALDSSTVVSVSSNCSFCYVYTFHNGGSTGGRKTSYQKVGQQAEVGHERDAIITQLVGVPEQAAFMTGDNKGKIVVWANATMSAVRSFSMTRIFKLPKGLKVKKEEDAAVRSMAFSAKHNVVAVAAGVHVAILPLPESYPTHEKAQKCDQPEALSKLAMGHRLPITQIRWLPGCEGQYLITASEDCSAKVWDVFSRDQRRVAARDAAAAAASLYPIIRTPQSAASTLRPADQMPTALSLAATTSHISLAGSRMRSSSSSVRKFPSPSPSGLFRSFFVNAKAKKTAAGGDESSNTPEPSPAGGASDRPLPLRTSVSDLGATLAPCEIPSHSSFRPFRNIIDKEKDVCCDLIAHTEKITGLATLPGTALAFLSSSSDRNVIMWTVGAYHELRATEAARAVRQQDFRGGDWPTWTNAAKWKMSVDEDSEWLSRGCELERKHRIQLLGIGSSDEYDRGHQDTAGIPRIPTTLSLLGSVTDISPYYSQSAGGGGGSPDLCLPHRGSNPSPCLTDPPANSHVLTMGSSVDHYSRLNATTSSLDVRITPIATRTSTMLDFPKHPSYAADLTARALSPGASKVFGFVHTPPENTSYMSIGNVFRRAGLTQSKQDVVADSSSPPQNYSGASSEADANRSAHRVLGGSPVLGSRDGSANLSPLQQMD